jgi:O-antigen/teichoic acid export membrane protein
MPRGNLARGAAATLVIKCVAMPITLLFQFALVRLLGAEAYGEFIYAFTWYVSLLPLASFGLQEATVRFVAEYRAMELSSTLQGYLRWSKSLALSAASLLSTAGIAVLIIFRSSFTPTLFWTFLILAVSIPLGSLAMVNSMILRAVERFVAAQVPHQIVQPLTALILVWIAVVGLGAGKIAPVAAGAMLVSSSLFLFTSQLLSVSAFRNIKSSVPPEYRVREWTVSAVHFVGLAAIALLTRADVLMLGVLTDTFTAGIYATAVQLHVFAQFAFNTMAFVIGPRIAKLQATGAKAELQKMLSMTTVGNTAVALAAGFVLIGFGRPILRFYDGSFVEGYVPLVILVFSVIYNVLTGPVGLILTMTGKHREALTLTGIAVGLNVVLNASLIPVMGMNGAAVATATTIVCWKTVGLVVVRKTLGVDPSLWSLTKSLKAF